MALPSPDETGHRYRCPVCHRTDIRVNGHSPIAYHAGLTAACAGWGQFPEPVPDADRPSADHSGTDEPGRDG